MAKTEKERSSVEYAMSAMKILGLNPKNSRKFGDLLEGNRNLSTFDVLIAGICLESKLPLLTGMQKKFRSVKGLTVIPATTLSDKKVAARTQGNLM